MTAGIKKQMNTPRQYRRFAKWDYKKGASLFITIATAPRKALFGAVIEGRVVLSPLGKVVDESLAAIPKLNPGISLFKRVVMPDHVHFSVCIEPGLDEPLKTLGKAIGRFKNYTTKRAKVLGVIGNSPIIAGSGGRAVGSDGQAVPGQSASDLECRHSVRDLDS